MCECLCIVFETISEVFIQYTVTHLHHISLWDKSLGNNLKVCNQYILLRGSTEMFNNFYTLVYVLTICHNMTNVICYIKH